MTPRRSGARRSRWQNKAIWRPFGCAWTASRRRGRASRSLSSCRRSKSPPTAWPRRERPADSVAAAAEIVAAVAAGELTPSEAADLAKVVDVYVRAIATTAFDERLTKLEATTPR